ncbi:MAG: hypothetical protein ABIR66_12030, partial [Saprospiraceae bacterium]
YSVLSLVLKIAMNKRRTVFLFLLLSWQAMVYSKNISKWTADTIPFELQGKFIDDYEIHYTINDSLWIQTPNVKYHIIHWDTTAKYLLARNDDKNPSENGLFTRIDYMNFSHMEPFQWGFCYTIYNAKTVEEAKIKALADRQNPRNGCNGYPFSRMKRND